MTVKESVRNINVLFALIAVHCYSTGIWICLRPLHWMLSITVSCWSVLLHRLAVLWLSITGHRLLTVTWLAIGLRLSISWHRLLTVTWLPIGLGLSISRHRLLTVTWLAKGLGLSISRHRWLTVTWLAIGLGLSISRHRWLTIARHLLLHSWICSHLWLHSWVLLHRIKSRHRSKMSSTIRIT